MESLFTGSFLLISLLQSVFGLKPKEVCLLQVDEGSCRAYIPRFYYNTISQECEEFIYGGCSGNANNFESIQECRKTCYTIPKIPRICRFPKEEGRCRALLRRFYFNMTSMQCDQFFYGGCDGNENNFHTPQSCMEYCVPSKSVPVICQDVLDNGKCSASIPRYYYNSATKTCEEFIYTGCGGSNNNFVSKQSCMDVCGRRSKKWKPRRRITSRRLQRLMHSDVSQP
ncbi:tissue factor pathway inhibitor 2 isoform X1 [Brachyhypopomus gauderio]|uniref:tissue factor pathway inhibitor 2 isoform X1 n=1 Tax=Brachyhypopomus gauderio TaxID=698409 RepID=UPI004042D120